MHHVICTKTPRMSSLGRPLHTVRTKKGILELPEEPTVASPDGVRTLRSRRYGNHPLPLPPILDPLAIAAKQRHRHAKSGADRSAQRPIHSNPYALALASPVRQCVVTRTRLPSHMLLPFLTDLSRGDHGEARALLRPAFGRSDPSPKSYVWGVEEIVDRMEAGRWQTAVNDRMKRRYALWAGKSFDAIKVGKEWRVEKEGMLGRAVMEGLRTSVLTMLKKVLGNEESVMILEAGNTLERARWADVACTLHFRGEGEERHQHPDPLLNFSLSRLWENQESGDLDELLKVVGQRAESIAILNFPQNMPVVLAVEKLRSYVQKD